jgi:5-(carboxyamino)imidazole ribonucleotide synthase
MSQNFSSDVRLAVLGGGQLGRMLIQEAVDLDVHVDVLDPDANAPCKNIAGSFTQGSLLDFNTVYNFAKNADVITIEIENVNVDALEKLENEGKKVFPQPAVIRMIQDKGLQKEFYKKHHIPTSPYFLIQTKDEISKLEHEFPFVQKLRTGGYDGRGVQKLDDYSNLDKAFAEPSVMEKLIDIEKEISIVTCRSVNGEISIFPCVELEFNQEANLVEFLFAPAVLSMALELQAMQIAREVTEKTGIVGLLAVEMFVTKNGDLLVNEIAPRPHNSGHQTIEANLTSQYGQHLRAILGLPLGSTDIIKPSVMVNILGEPGYSGNAKYQGLSEVLSEAGVYVHLYGKKETRPFRKMGHVTIIANTLEEAKKKAYFVKETLKVIS